MKTVCANCSHTLGWARMEASSSVHWLVSTLYCPLLEGRLSVAITDIIFCRPVAVRDTVMDGADARARPIGQPRTVTGSWMLESCTEPRSLTTGLRGDTSSPVSSFPSSSSASARDFRRVWKKWMWSLFFHKIYKRSERRKTWLCNFQQQVNDSNPDPILI